MTKQTQPVTSLSWGQRFALVDAFNPSDEKILEVFGLAPEELASARELRSQGTFKVDTTLNVEAYRPLFEANTNKAASTTTHAAPRSATKKVATTATGKRPGKKGNKISLAFTAIPASPVSVEQFAKQHNVSIAVLRQSKRFDRSGVEGEVRVKKSKETGQLMIWREMGTKGG